MLMWYILESHMCGLQKHFTRVTGHTETRMFGLETSVQRIKQQNISKPQALIHPHVCTAGAVVRPPEDLRHVLQHVHNGQQITAIAGPIAGSLL